MKAKPSDILLLAAELIQVPDELHFLRGECKCYLGCRAVAKAAWMLDASSADYHRAQLVFRYFRPSHHHPLWFGDFEEPANQRRRVIALLFAYQIALDEETSTS